MRSDLLVGSTGALCALSLAGRVRACRDDGALLVAGSGAGVDDGGSRFKARSWSLFRWMFSKRMRSYSETPLASSLSAVVWSGFMLLLFLAICCTLLALTGTRCLLVC